MWTIWATAPTAPSASSAAVALVGNAAAPWCVPGWIRWKIYEGVLIRLLRLLVWRWLLPMRSMPVLLSSDVVGWRRCGLLLLLPAAHSSC